MLERFNSPNLTINCACNTLSRRKFKTSSDYRIMIYIFVNSTSTSNNSILLTMRFLKLSSEDSCLILEVSYLALQFEVFLGRKSSHAVPV